MIQILNFIFLIKISLHMSIYLMFNYTYSMLSHKRSILALRYREYKIKVMVIIINELKKNE